MRTSFALDALNQAICQRVPGEAEKLIHHSDRGSRYLSIRYTERLTEAGIDTSVGSVGDCHDNALAESIVGPFKTEVIKFLGPWKSVGQVEWETLNRRTAQRNGSTGTTRRACTAPLVTSRRTKQRRHSTQA